MTPETNHVLNTFKDAFKDAFAPISDALKSFQNIELPEVARDFVKRTAATAKERTAEIHTGAETVTGALPRDGCYWIRKPGRKNQPQHPAGDLRRCRSLLLQHG